MHAYSCLNDPRVSGLTVLSRRTPLISLHFAASLHLSLFKHSCMQKRAKQTCLLSVQDHMPACHMAAVVKSRSEWQKSDEAAQSFQPVIWASIGLMLLELEGKDLVQKCFRTKVL